VSTVLRALIVTTVHTWLKLQAMHERNSSGKRKMSYTPNAHSNKIVANCAENADAACHHQVQKNQYWEKCHGFMRTTSLIRGIKACTAMQDNSESK